MFFFTLAASNDVEAEFWPINYFANELEKDRRFRGYRVCRHGAKYPVSTFLPCMFFLLQHWPNRIFQAIRLEFVFQVFESMHAA